MKARYSPQVTGRSAIAKGSRKQRWRGPSLSNANPAPSWPIQTTPPSNDRNASAGAAAACRARRRRAGVIAGLQRVRSEGVLDVGEQQLLVLLFVVQAEGDRRGDRGCDGPASAVFQQPADRLVDVAAIGVDLVERRAGEAAAARPIVLRPDTLVVRVEEKLEGRVERPVVGQVRLQHERLEEPGRVGEVPLGGAGVRHRLHPLVLGRKRRRQLEGARADRAVFVEEPHLRTPVQDHSNDSACRPER